jgi:hypothetical protein
VDDNRVRFYWVRAVNLFGEVSDFEPDLTTTTATAGAASQSPGDILDPDFDLTTSANPLLFWDANEKDALGSTRSAAVTLQVGGGANSSNAFEILTSDGGGAGGVVALISVSRFRANTTQIEIQLRYRSTAAITGTGSVGFFYLIEGFDAQVGGTEHASVGTLGIDLPNTASVWTTRRYVVDVPADDDAQYWQVTLGILGGFLADPGVEFDSIFINAVPGIFGTATQDGKVQGGLVPLSDASTDPGKVLEAGGVWVVKGDMLLGTVQEITAAKQYNDNVELRFGTGNDVQWDFDGTDFNIAGTGDWNISGFAACRFDSPIVITQPGGGAKDFLRMRDSTDTTDLVFHYNGVAFELRSENSGAGNEFMQFDNSGLVTFGNEKTVLNTAFMNERAAAVADVAGDGQFWVRDDAPNVPMFTDDDGSDQLIDPSISEINPQNSNYTLVLGDKGKTIRKESGGAGETYTIPANASVAFQIGTFIGFDNEGGGDLTIAITTDTLIFADDGSTGSRTLADSGYAVAQKVAATTWKIAGRQLS